LGSKTPLQAMKDWHKLKPELFRKQLYHLPGCDTTRVSGSGFTLATLPEKKVEGHEQAAAMWAAAYPSRLVA